VCVQPLRLLIVDITDNNTALGEKYGLIAYGEAAAVCLEVALKPLHHCISLICYYPSYIPNHSKTNYSSQLEIVAHITNSQELEEPEFKHYLYYGVEPGFAERDMEDFNRVAAGLAWSRSLGAVNKAFKRDPNLEEVGETFASLALGHEDAAATIRTMTTDAYVNNIPTSTGGVGKRALYHFYQDFFIPGNPPSLRTKLISRTTGVNRIIDEVVVSFKHTQEMPWILPGVPPTGKPVQIPIVSIVAVRGGKVEHEHVYWDQASVLVQIGALDPENVPKELASKGCKKLPVVGVEAAKRWQT